MYGSNYSYQMLTAKRISTVELENRIGFTKNEEKNTFLVPWLALVIMIISLSSSATFAGPSQPRLPGSNGNSSGR